MAMNGEDNSLVESNKSGFFSKVDGFFDLIRRKANWLIYSFLFVIIWVASSIRLSNLPLLKDTVTGSYIPTALDPYYFLRYAQHILEHGSLMAHDVMRYSPLGTDVSFSSSGVIVSYVNVYLYKIFSIFNNNITLGSDYFSRSINCFFWLVSPIFFSRVYFF